VPSKDGKGQIEKFKISNPNKIPCTVKFSAKPRTTSKSEGFAFEISPESMRIMPHEHNYVKVCFKPINIMSYGGIFEATVENGDPKGKSGKLRFELRGEGVLPSVIMEKPILIGDDGNPLLKFKRTRVDKSQKEAIVLKNDGSVPATVQFNPIKSDVFSLVSPSTATILPKSYQSFEIAFEPREIGESKCLVSFSTVHNPYELQKVGLFGEGYKEVVVFEGLPNNSEDELVFGDCPLDRVKKVQCSITSKSDKTLRFEWLMHKPEVKCYPRVGYLKPQATKSLTFSFKAKDPIKIDNEELWCRISEIKAKEGGKIADWDESMTETRLVRPSELKALIKKRAEEDKKKQEEAEVVVGQILAQKAAAAGTGKGKARRRKKRLKRK
jgi:hydrocephalus-inducing protein